MGALADFLDPVGAIIGAVLGSVGSFIRDTIRALAWDMQILSQYVLEPILHFLGFNDEDIYQVSVCAVRIFDDDLYPRTQLRLVTEYMKKESKDALWYATNFSQTGDAQFDKYYRFGKWYYIDYLPSIQISCTTVKESEVKAILSALHNDSDVFIDEIGVMPPFDDDWCKWRLQEVFDYDIGNDSLALNDQYYSYGGTSYDANTGNFVVTLSAISSIRETVVETTEATVIPRENDEIQRVVVTRVTTKYNATTGSTLNKVITPISSTDTVVATGTGTTYNTETLISSNTTTTNWTDTTTTVAYHDNIRRYVAKYSSMDTGRYYYWIYNTLDGTYPALSNPVSQVNGLEGYPICMLRNGFNDISNYNGSGQYGHSKPSTISKRRYEATKELMSALGLDVNDIINGYSSNPDIDKLQDCFFLYGVSPSDGHWIVSRVLYEMFDFIYDKMPYTGYSDSYSASFKEDPYNAALIWSARPTTIKIEHIGDLGKCTHSVTNITITTTKVTTRQTTRVGNQWRVTETVETTTTSSLEGVIKHEVTTPTTYYVDILEEGMTLSPSTTETTSSSSRALIIKKQITSTTTKTIVLNSVSTFSIIRNTLDGYNGGEALDIGDSDLVIPIPVPVVERLTLMEKTALLGRSAYLVFYSYQHQHIKWYQTEAFASFMSTIATVISVVVTVVVTIFTIGNPFAGGSAGLSVYGLLMGLFQTALIAGALQLALYIINETVQDANLKLALTLIASMIAIVASAGLGGGFNFGTAIQLAELPIKAAEMYVNESMKQISKKMQGLQQETQAFNQQYESRTKQFEDVLKGLNSGLDVSATVGLAVEANDDFLMNTDRGFLINPDLFYSVATTACYNYDTLYTGYYDMCVHKFVRNKKTLGVLDTTGDE